MYHCFNNTCSNHTNRWAGWASREATASGSGQRGSTGTGSTRWCTRRASAGGPDRTRLYKWNTRVWWTSGVLRGVTLFNIIWNEICCMHKYIFVTIVRHIVPAWNESFEIWLSVFTWKKWVVLIKVSREKHVYLISSVYCSIVYEEENISQHAAPSYQNLIIQHMDIAEPLSTLKSLLELRLQCTLSDHQFYLQDTIEVQFIADHLHIIVVFSHKTNSHLIQRVTLAV